MKTQKATSVLVMIIAACSGITGTTYADSTPLQRQLDIGNTTLNYTVSGSGDTIVSVHGAVSDLRVWEDYQQPMSENHQFVTYTRRYYGTTPWPEGQHIYDASVHASDLASLIRSLDSGPVHLLARSSGGYAAAITAAKHPELVRSLVLWEPYVGNDFVPSAGFDEKSIEMINTFRKGFAPAAKAAKSKNHETAVEHFIEHVYELDSGGFHKLPANLQQMFYDNSRTLELLYSGKTTDKVTCDFLNRIQSPTLVLRGGDTDPGYALTHIKAADCITGSKLAVVEGVVHNGAGHKVTEITDLAVNFWNTLK